MLQVPRHEFRDVSKPPRQAFTTSSIAFETKAVCVQSLNLEPLLTIVMLWRTERPPHHMKFRSAQWTPMCVIQGKLETPATFETGVRNEILCEAYGRLSCWGSDVRRHDQHATSLSALLFGASCHHLDSFRSGLEAILARILGSARFRDQRRAVRRQLQEDRPLAFGPSTRRSRRPLSTEVPRDGVAQ